MIEDIELYRVRIKYFGEEWKMVPRIFLTWKDADWWAYQEGDHVQDYELVLCDGRGFPTKNSNLTDNERFLEMTEQVVQNTLDHYNAMREQYEDDPASNEPIIMYLP